MDNPLKGQTALYKLTAISAAGLLVGFGLCGVGTLLPEHAMNFFFVIGASVFWLSALAMVVSLLWWIIRGFIKD